MPIARKDTTGRWAVNGTPLFEPSQHPTISHDIVEGAGSGRTEDGKYHRDLLRSDVVTVSITYGLMTGDELEELVSLVQGKEYEGTYCDYGKAQTRSMRTDSVSYGQYYDDMFPDEGGLYRDVSFEMVEN